MNSVCEESRTQESRVFSTLSDNHTTSSSARERPRDHQNVSRPIFYNLLFVNLTTSYVYEGVYERRCMIAPCTECPLANIYTAAAVHLAVLLCRCDPFAPKRSTVSVRACRQSSCGGRSGGEQPCCCSSLLLLSHCSAALPTASAAPSQQISAAQPLAAASATALLLKRRRTRAAAAGNIACNSVGHFAREYCSIYIAVERAISV